jgi:hypothetical protein
MGTGATLVIRIAGRAGERSVTRRDAREGRRVALALHPPYEPELNDKGFQRAAGAMAGVVLEEHLATVCEQHNISTPKNATILKLNDVLKANDVADVPTWRFVQRLGDITSEPLIRWSGISTSSLLE